MNKKIHSNRMINKYAVPHTHQKKKIRKRVLHDLFIASRCDTLNKYTKHDKTNGLLNISVLCTALCYE